LALSDPAFQLAFLSHVHELATSEGILSGIKRFAPQHRTRDALHAAMILFHNIIQIEGEGN
jgi:hypothetical protein